MKIRFVVAIIAFVVGWAIILGMVGMGVFYVARRPLVAGYERACAQGGKSACTNLTRMLRFDCWLGDVHACHDLGYRLLKAEPKRAAELFKKACAAKFPRGCSSWAWALETGTGTQKDTTAALENYEKGCDGKDGPGCCGFGTSLIYGNAGKQDYSRAREVLKSGCALKNGCSCTQLGYLLERGLGGAADVAAAVARYEDGCDNGDEMACGNYGYMVWQGKGTDADADAAAFYLASACESSDPVFCAYLGEIHEKDEPEAARAEFAKACRGGVYESCARVLLGKGGEDDRVVAARQLTAICRKENASACNDAGWAQQEGLGTEKDPARARALYEKSCGMKGAGAARGCANLAWMLFNGVGGAVDKDKALALFTKSCDGGDPSGCANLGMRYREKKDYAKAIELFRRGCADKYANACGNLGIMMVKGWGTKRDVAGAASLLKEGCDDGDQEACGLLASETHSRARASGKVARKTSAIAAKPSAPASRHKRR